MTKNKPAKSKRTYKKKVKVSVEATLPSFQKPLFEASIESVPTEQEPVEEPIVKLTWLQKLWKWLSV